MARRGVNQRVDRVQPEAVEVVVAQPHQRVVAEEPADFVASRIIEIHGVAPWGVVPMGEIRAEPAEVIACRPEVVVHDVENHREATGMAGVDEPLQIVRTTVAMMRGEQVDPIVPPATGSGELAYGHQLEMRDAKSDK